MNAARSIAIAISPFIPDSAQKIWQQIGLKGKPSDNTWDDISKVVIEYGHKLNEITPLFSKVDEADIAKHKKRLGPS